MDAENFKVIDTGLSIVLSIILYLTLIATIPMSKKLIPRYIPLVERKINREFTSLTDLQQKCYYFFIWYLCAWLVTLINIVSSQIVIMLLNMYTENIYG